jgi:hypothetical protein
MDIAGSQFLVKICMEGCGLYFPAASSASKREANRYSTNLLESDGECDCEIDTLPGKIGMVPADL